eukprot:scaffold144255_cov205-Phaeocystis_antarctica.AAC.1
MSTHHAECHDVSPATRRPAARRGGAGRRIRHRLCARHQQVEPARAHVADEASALDRPDEASALDRSTFSGRT